MGSNIARSHSLIGWFSCLLVIPVFGDGRKKTHVVLEGRRASLNRGRGLFRDHFFGVHSQCRQNQ